MLSGDGDWDWQLIPEKYRILVKLHPASHITIFHFFNQKYLKASVSSLYTYVILFSFKSSPEDGIAVSITGPIWILRVFHSHLLFEEKDLSCLQSGLWMRVFRNHWHKLGWFTGEAQRKKWIYLVVIRQENRERNGAGLVRDFES